MEPSCGWLLRLLNLKRAVQVLTLPTADGVPLTILHTHLSAFTNGDSTVALQVEVLQRLAADAGPRWLLAGDFNALAPGVSCHKYYGQAYRTVNSSIVESETAGVGEFVSCLDSADAAYAWEFNLQCSDTSAPNVCTCDPDNNNKLYHAESGVSCADTASTRDPAAIGPSRRR